MDTGFRPISVSTTLSLLLHASLAVAVLQTRDVMQATGRGLEIELVSSSYISEQHETERAANRAVSLSEQNWPAEQPERNTRNTPTENIQTRQDAEMEKSASVPASDSDSTNNDAGEKAVTRSTDAVLNNSAIIELLHSEISEHKQYPYMARKQRREGVARVGFMLYPDGSIDDAHLLNSSRTRSLDDAAIRAVESIEPFSAAREYLQQPESFQVDIVFSMR